MPTTYTSLLGLALPATGELSGTWGTTVNTEITALLDTAVAGTTTLSVDADVTLSTTTGAANQARQAIILWTANGTVTRNITAPAASKTYVVINASAGTQSIVLRGVGPTAGVTIVKGESAVVAWNGSDFVKVSNTSGAGSFTNLSVSGTTTLSGLTASTALALDASKNVVSVTNTGTGNNVLATSPTLTTPNLGTPSAIVLTNASGTASININGTVGATTPNTGAFTTLSASGVASFSAGTAAAPALARTTDTGTGMWFPAAGTAAWSTAGVERMRLSASGLLVGTTTNTNSSQLVANGTISETVSSTQWLVASQYDVGTAPNQLPLNQYLGTMAFQDSANYFQIGGTGVFGAGTAAAPSVTTTGDTDTGVFFPAANTVALGTSATERMRITSAGNVGINETAPDYRLDVNGTFGFTPGSSVTPVDNGDVVFEATNNTTLTVKLRGSDGVVRSGTITLA